MVATYGAVSVPAGPGSSGSAAAKHARLVSLNPFKYNLRLHSGPLQLIKMVVVGLVLFVPRVLILVLALAMMAIAAKLRLCCCPAAPPADCPRDGNGRPLAMPIRGGAVSMLFLRLGARMVLFAFGYWWISVHDRRTNKKAAMAPIIACNHVSFLDAFLFAYLDAPMGVGKAELFKIPIIGSIAQATQMIGVAREDGKRAHSAADEIKRRTRFVRDQPADIVDEFGCFPPLLIFPEATCTNTSCIIQFKLGAFAPLMPVQPVTLDLRQSHLDASWVDAVSPAMTALRLMCQVYNRCSITYLPVVDPPADGNVQTFSQMVRTAIASSLDVPCTQHNFLDILLAHEAHRLRLPRGNINVQMGQFDGDKDALDRIKGVLKEFAAIDKNRDGCLDEEEFAVVLGFDNEALRLAHGTLIRAAFQHWDRDGDGKINFREYLLLSSAVKVSKLTQQMQLAADVRREAAGRSTDSAASTGHAVIEPLSPGTRPPRTAGNVQSPSGSPGSVPSESPFGDEVPGVAVGGVRGPTGTIEEALLQHEEEADESMEPGLKDAFALAFSAFDLDGDGVVKAKDVADTLKNVAPGIDIKQARALFFAAADVKPSGSDNEDGDVTVSLAQYLRLCERHPVLVGSFLDAIAALGTLSPHPAAGAAAAGGSPSGSGANRSGGAASPFGGSRDSRHGDSLADDMDAPDLGALSKANTFVAETTEE